MDSTVIVAALSLLALVLIAALLFAIRVILSIQQTLASQPTAQISSGVMSCAGFRGHYP